MSNESINVLQKLNSIMVIGNNSIINLVNKLEDKSITQSDSCVIKQQEILSRKIDAYINHVYAAISMKAIVSDPFGVITGEAFKPNTFQSKCAEESIERFCKEQPEIFTVVDAMRIKAAVQGTGASQGFFKNGVKWVYDKVTGGLTFVKDKVVTTVCFIKNSVVNFYTYIKEVIRGFISKFQSESESEPVAA